MFCCFISESVVMARSLGLVMLMLAGQGSSMERRAECEMWSHLENKTMPLQVTDQKTIFFYD